MTEMDLIKAQEKIRISISDRVTFCETTQENQSELSYDRVGELALVRSL